ncbi:MAG: crossover junction endodeoxyribonuclease RuvC [Dissulfuribacterales bacterium]
MKNGLILGIDPGSLATGYGVVRVSGNRLSCVETGVIRLASNATLAARLERLYKALQEIIQRLHPTDAAVETVFQSVNVRSALVLSHVRGVALLAAVHGAMHVYEYTPIAIKKAVTGYGRAEKQQVRQMVRLILGTQQSMAQDASDALAVAICHANSRPLNACENVVGVCACSIS